MKFVLLIGCSTYAYIWDVIKFLYIFIKTIMDISIDLIKQFREMTMASVKDCKACLIEANGDIELAKEILKKKWLANAAKKADREMNEWVVKFENRNGRLVWVSVSCETDFVSRGEMFVDLIENLLSELSNLNIEVSNFGELPQDIADKLTTMVNELVGKIGENMKIWALVSKSLWDNTNYIYNHNNGKLSAVVAYKALSANAEDAAKKIALQSAAMNPDYSKLEDVPSDYVEKIKAEFVAEVAASGKPANIIENIVAGKLNKQLSEMVLVEQSYIWDETKKIKDIIKDNIEFISCDRYSI